MKNHNGQNISFSLSGQIADVVSRKIFSGTLVIENGKIIEIKKENVSEKHFILPGFVDAHVHIESSMLIPSEFARLAVVHGTVATVSDPHEIGNVLGIEGVKYMIENGKKVPFKFYFGAPSCVPATIFETAGAKISADDIEELMEMDEINYLAEMMNFPGVLNEDEEVMQKIFIAHKFGKVVDGHAPGLRGEDAKKYIEAGITTDHECFTKEEALDKLKYGMKIIIREGSAAKNFDALISLLNEYPDKIMFCSDDKHPNDLANGHINLLLSRAVKQHKIDPMNAIIAATKNPVKHYGMNVGLLQKGDPADCIVVDNLENFNVLKAFINGKKVAENGKSLIASVEEKIVNRFLCEKIQALTPIPSPLAEGSSALINIIEVMDGQLITNRIKEALPIKKGNLYSDAQKDVLKLVVVNRYENAQPAVAFVKNMGLKKGAIASSVAHDSHNIIAVGVDDEDILSAINLLIESKGGVSLADGDNKKNLALPVAGLMSTEDGYKVAEQYEGLDAAAKALGSSLLSPYMTLSFLALLVIPELKLSDKGLFDGKEFKFIPLLSEKETILN
jgi:adenine deaminase